MTKNCCLSSADIRCVTLAICTWGEGEVTTAPGSTIEGWVFSPFPGHSQGLGPPGLTLLEKRTGQEMKGGRDMGQGRKTGSSPLAGSLGLPSCWE